MFQALLSCVVPGSECTCKQLCKCARGGTGGSQLAGGELPALRGPGHVLVGAGGMLPVPPLPHGRLTPGCLAACYRRQQPAALLCAAGPCPKPNRSQTLTWGKSTGAGPAHGQAPSRGVGWGSPRCPGDWLPSLGLSYCDTQKLRLSLWGCH